MFPHAHTSFVVKTRGKINKDIDLQWYSDMAWIKETVGECLLDNVLYAVDTIVVESFLDVVT